MYQPLLYHLLEAITSVCHSYTNFPGSVCKTSTHLLGDAPTYNSLKSQLSLEKKLNQLSHTFT